MADRVSDQFVVFVQMSPPQRRAALRRARALQWGGVLFAWFWFGLLLYLLWPVALSSSYSRYMIAPPDLGTALWDILILLIVPIPVLLFTALTVPSKVGWYGSEIVRADMFAGRGRLTIMAIDQPKPLPDGDALPGADAFAPLRFPAPSWFMTALAAIDILFVVAGVALAFVLSHRASGATALTTSGAPWPQSNLDLAMFEAPLIGVGKLFALYGAPYIAAFGWWIFLPGCRQKLLAIDDQGIRWRERHWRMREYTLAWQDIEVFCISRYFGERGTTSTYLLLGRDVSFAWVIASRAHETQKAASDALARLAMKHTRRPLLDLTATMNVVKYMSLPFGLRAAATDHREPGKTLWAELKAVEGNARRTTGAALVGTALGLARPERPLGMGWRFYGAHLALLILVAVGAIGWLSVNQQRADAYYRTLYPRITSQMPLYSDPLTAADGAWPVQTASPADLAQLSFTNGGYTINGGPAYSDYAIWRGARYSDLAVAVTVRPAPGWDFGFVGLAARVQTSGVGDADEVVFDIRPDGNGLSWDLMHMQPPPMRTGDGISYLAGGDVTGAHIAAGAGTRLLLVVVGNRYLCYINGQFVGGAEDPAVSSSSPPAGYAGLYVFDHQTAAVFNDFALYASPPYQPLFGGL